MKKQLIVSLFLTAAALAAGSCAKPLADIDITAPTGTGPLVEVVFSAMDAKARPLTRATGVVPADEQNVSRWAVFAFDNESGWYAYATSASGTSVTINLRARRSYTCYAIVNYPMVYLDKIISFRIHFIDSIMKEFWINIIITVDKGYIFP